ncbi:MAG: hypothetical protein R3C01_17995 [Planctomycetaceae bacterium]
MSHQVVVKSRVCFCWILSLLMVSAIFCSTSTPIPAADEGAPSKPAAVNDSPNDEPLSEFDTLLELRKATPFPVDDPTWMQDPFTVLELEMLDASGDLKSGATRPPAEVTQPRIISRLDQIIQKLEQQCNGSKSGSNMSTNPNKPAESSTLRNGTAPEGELRATDSTGGRWAKIPPKERERILQAREEGFPPGYEDILADYFRRLSRTEAPPTPEPAP